VVRHKRSGRGKIWRSRLCCNHLLCGGVSPHPFPTQISGYSSTLCPFHSFQVKLPATPSPTLPHSFSTDKRKNKNKNKKQKKTKPRAHGSVSCHPSPGPSMATRPLQSRLRWSQLVDLMVTPSSRRRLARDRSRALYGTTHHGSGCLATCVRHQEFHNSGGDRSCLEYSWHIRDRRG